MAVIGLITVNGKEILEVDAVPSSGGGIASPKGSIAMYDTGTVGEVYIKSGAADTAWSLIEIPDNSDWNLAGNTLTGAEFLGSLNDQDVYFKRNNIEQMRIVSGAILMGLNASLGGRLQVAGAALGDELLKQISPNGGSGSQVIKVSRQYKVQTTDATLTTLFDYAVPTDSVIYLKTEVAARQHGGVGGAVGDGAAYVRDTHARNNAGTVTIRKNQTSFTSEDLNAFDLIMSVSTTNVRAQVQGAVDRNMAWFAHTEALIAVN